MAQRYSRRTASTKRTEWCGSPSSIPLHDEQAKASLRRNRRDFFAAVLDFDAAAERLPNLLQQLREPRGFDFERLAALDAGKLDGAQTVALVFIVTHDPGFAAQAALYGVVDHALNQAQVVDVGRGGAREIA